MLDSLQRWLNHEHAVVPFAFVGVGAFLLSFVGGIVLVVLLPADYFVRGSAQTGFWHSHPALRITLLVAKNLVGAMTLLAGLVMAVPLVPGPGLLFVLVGIGLLDFPGKRALERRFLRFPKVFASVNKLRARFGRPPIAIE
jgi:hypothetical protein